MVQDMFVELRKWYGFSINNSTHWARIDISIHIIIQVGFFHRNTRSHETSLCSTVFFETIVRIKLRTRLTHLFICVLSTIITHRP